MDQVVGGIDTLKGGAEGGFVQDVPLDDLRGCGHPRTQKLRSARQTPQAAAGGFQSLDQPASDVAGGSGQQHKLLAIGAGRTSHCLPGVLKRCPRCGEPARGSLLLERAFPAGRWTIRNAQIHARAYVGYAASCTATTRCLPRTNKAACNRSALVSWSGSNMRRTIVSRTPSLRASSQLLMPASRIAW